MDKLNASHRLDMNLEKSRSRDELSKLADKSLASNTQLDREVHALRARIEKEKSDILRYSVGTMAAMTGLGLGIVRLLM